MRTAALPTTGLGRRQPAPDGDELSAYLGDIAAYPLLTAEDELALGRRAATGDQAAQTQLVQCNLRLVVEVARRYHCPALTIMDLIQEGNMGLMRAAEKYDYTRGYRFSTYAVWWIRMAMTRAIKSQGTTIRVPEYLYRRDEPADDRGEDQPAARDVRRDAAEHARAVVSLDRARHTEPGDSREAALASVADPDVASIEEEPAGRLIVGEVRSVMELLPPRDCAIIAYRYGLDGQVAHSLAETAEVFGVKRQRIAQIEARALATLKMRAYNRGLQEYVVAS